MSPAGVVKLPRVTIDLEASAFVEGMRRAQDAVTLMADRLAKVTAIFGNLTERYQAQRRVRHAGLCARYQVRAGLDPRYASPEARDALVMRLMKRQEWPLDPWMDTWDDAERAELAAAVIRGWVEHYDNGPAPKPCPTVCAYGECSAPRSTQGCGGCCGCLGGCQVEWEESQPRVFDWPPRRIAWGQDQVAEDWDF
jgi:hypothetical protein